MKKTPKISEAEWEVMKTVWEQSPRTANDIVQVLSKKTRWQRETIRTLINRLVQKKALGFERKGRAYHYYPLVGESECVMAESRSFLRRVYGGALMPMLANFLEGEELSPEEIAALRRILDERGG